MYIRSMETAVVLYIEPRGRLALAIRLSCMYFDCLSVVCLSDLSEDNTSERYNYLMWDGEKLFSEIVVRRFVVARRLIPCR